MKNSYTLPNKLATAGQLFLLAAALTLMSETTVAQTYATLPYTTGFESGVFDAHWTTTSSLPTGEVAIFGPVGTASPHTGSYFMGEHHPSAGGGAYNLNEAWLHLDFTSQPSIVMDFWWAEWNEETEPQDGLYISNDAGVTFTKFLDLNGASYTDLQWYHFTLNMDSVLTDHSLSKTATMVIKFQQYDNYYFNGGNDGFLFDDLNIYSVCVPVAGYNFSVNYPGKTATFVNTSTDSSSVLWDFDDGNTSTTPSPTHTFTAAGNYNVCMSVTKTCGSDTICQNVPICDPLTADYSSVTTSLDVAFTNLSSSTSNVKWTFGDGKVSTQASPTHHYSTAGTYYACMSTTDDCQTISFCDSVKACDPISPAFLSTTGGHPTEYGFIYTGTGATPSSYVWNFGDGSSGTGPSPTHKYTSNGTFLITLTTFDDCGGQFTATDNVTITAAGIEGYAQEDISIYPNPNNGVFTINIKRDYRVEVRNVEGQLVYSSGQRTPDNKGANTIDLEGASPGVYFVHVYTSVGELTRKILVK